LEAPLYKYLRYIQTLTIDVGDILNQVILYRAYEFDFEEEELIAMKTHFHTVPNRTNINPNSLVIGRYSVLPFYKELEEDLKINNSTLINTYEQHKYIADLQNWYADLHEYTPKTWFKLEDLPKEIKGSFVLKGETNSKKAYGVLICLLKIEMK